MTDRIETFKNRVMCAGAVTGVMSGALLIGAWYLDMGTAVAVLRPITVISLAMAWLVLLFSPEVFSRTVTRAMVSMDRIVLGSSKKETERTTSLLLGEFSEKKDNKHRSL